MATDDLRSILLTSGASIKEPSLYLVNNSNKKYVIFVFGEFSEQLPRKSVRTGTFYRCTSPPLNYYYLATFQRDIHVFIAVSYYHKLVSTVQFHLIRDY